MVIKYIQMLEPFIKVKNHTGHINGLKIIYYDAYINKKMFKGVRYILKHINTTDFKQEMIVVDNIHGVMQR